MVNQIQLRNRNFKVFYDRLMGCLSKGIEGSCSKTTFFSYLALDVFVKKSQEPLLKWLFSKSWFFWQFDELKVPWGRGAVWGKVDFPCVSMTPITKEFVGKREQTWTLPLVEGSNGSFYLMSTVLPLDNFHNFYQQKQVHVWQTREGMIMGPIEKELIFLNAKNTMLSKRIAKKIKKY